MQINFIINGIYKHRMNVGIAILILADVYHDFQKIVSFLGRLAGFILI